MRKVIDHRVISDMTASLENAELGAAMRILGRILSSGKPLPASRLRIVSQMSEEQWEASSSAILEFFILDGETVTHSSLADSEIPSASAPGRPQAGRTGNLPIVEPTRRQSVPAWPKREQSDRISIKSAAFEIIVRLFEEAGQTSNTARSVMASFLKNWPEGDVYQAVSQADRQDFLADPRSWILASLKRNSQPLTRQSRQHAVSAPAPTPRKPREITRPEVVGVSERTANEIRSRNGALGLNLDLLKGTDA